MVTLLSFQGTAPMKKTAREVPFARRGRSKCGDQRYQDQQGGGGKGHGVEPIQHTSVAGQQVTIVLDAKLPLDEGKGQVAYLGHRAADEAIYRHDGQRNRQPGKLLQNHAVEQQENAAGQED